MTDSIFSYPLAYFFLFVSLTPSSVSSFRTSNWLDRLSASNSNKLRSIETAA